jgi:hypothetical protein
MKNNLIKLLVLLGIAGSFPLKAEAASVKTDVWNQMIGNVFVREGSIENNDDGSTTFKVTSNYPSCNAGYVLGGHMHVTYTTTSIFGGTPDVVEFYMHLNNLQGVNGSVATYTVPNSVSPLGTWNMLDYSTCVSGDTQASVNDYIQNQIDAAFKEADIWGDSADIVKDVYKNN